MLGVTPLTRLLPDMFEDVYGSLLTNDEDDDDSTLLENAEVDDSEVVVFVSGIILSMFSSSLTISNIDGRFSGSSRQQLRAKARNLSTQSDGYDPILLSTMEKILPHCCAIFT